jgi:hypothetical protein
MYGLTYAGGEAFFLIPPRTLTWLWNRSKGSLLLVWQIE